ncbi:MAG: hypothetical protein ACRDKW_09890 [Actinomycetota bacterium]
MTELGDLLASTALAVPRAQEELDRFGAERCVRPGGAAGGGVVHLPPLAYVFTRVGLDLELVAELGPAEASAPPRLLARVPAPGPFGPPANLRIRLDLAPRDLATLSSATRGASGP